MTQDKAREYFSAYHEGSLEPGLRASLDRRLDEDPGLRADMSAFVETVVMLDAMRHASIASPTSLSDRIATRLENARETVIPRPFWASLFAPRPAAPQLAWGVGMAALLLVSAFGLRGMRTENATQASALPTSLASVVTWTKNGSNVVANFESGPARQIAVQPEGGKPQSYALAAGQRFELALSNPNVSARRFKVTVGADLLATIAMPGSRLAPRRSGTGTVTEFASALAAAYGVPVVVKSMAIDSTLNWKLDGTDPRAAADAALDGHGSAVLTDGGVLQIGG